MEAVGVTLNMEELLMPTNGKKFANFVNVSVTLYNEPEAHYSENGTFVVRARASQYMGKDKAGEYRPSKWWTLKAFAKGEEAEKPDTAAAALASLSARSKVTVKGRLDYVEFTRKDNTPGSEDVIIVSEVAEVFGDGNGQGSEGGEFDEDL